MVNSNYNALQLSLKKQTSHGMAFNLNYTYSHAIDDGSTWHSGSTSSNGAGGGEGYTTDADSARPRSRKLDLSTSGSAWLRTTSWSLPWYKSQQGFIGHVSGWLAVQRNHLLANRRALGALDLYQRRRPFGSIGVSLTNTFVPGMHRRPRSTARSA